MSSHLTIYNTLSRKLEKFEPINPNHVGMYVCGPTVYGDPHLGHARPAITFDILFRYLQYIGYKVRYVRNITDVGHLEHDADEGEDKIAKKAKLEQVEPMEIVQFYTNRYRYFINLLNVLPPSIEPHASGHIIEQQLMIQKIIDAGFAYEVNGSVYFDVEKYNSKYNYGKLSGRVLEELYKNTRESLESQDEKKNAFDFSLWKKAKPEHIMRWPSKWSEGFPGWHLECSAMGMKYLGEHFDIHGGGLDLIFPHHECEIAQSVATLGKDAVKYWIHNNLITINGQKMSKSLNNFISLEQLFAGNNDLLAQAYSPMTIRLFILQAHYRSPLDFSNDALQAAGKGFDRLISAIKNLDKIAPTNSSSFSVHDLKTKCIDAMNDDLNTPILLAHLFTGVKAINSALDGTESFTSDDLNEMKKLYNDMVFKVLGLADEEKSNSNNEVFNKVVDLLLNIRHEAKLKKDFATSDKIRNQLAEFGFEIKDRKDGFDWNLK